MMTHGETQIHRLDNGLRIAIASGGTAPEVGIALYYDVGSRNEQRGASGFAHLFEHMMFQGSENVAKSDHFRLVSEWGGQANGTTSQDRTNYFQSLPAHQLALGLWLEADRMRSLRVDSANFENQRQTVMEERRERIDNSPYGAASVRHGELSFSSFAYSHPVIGYWEDLEAARLDQVQEFHQRWYRPDNAVLSLAGALDPADALELCEKFFGDIDPGGVRPEPEIDEVPRREERTELVADPLARLPAVFLNHQASGYGSADFPVWEVIESVLLMGASSRLFRRLVVDEAAAVQIGGGYDCHRGPGLFGIQAFVRDISSLDRVRALYMEELERLAREPVEENELQKVYNQIRAAMVFGQQRALSRALTNGRNLLFHGNADFLQTYLREVEAVRPAQVQELVARVLEQGKMVDLRVIPR